jgi:hypothetical protein
VKGWFISRIRKTDPATATAATRSTVTTVPFGGAKRPKPTNRAGLD